VTVDGNPFLPLLRYRTGDTGVLGWDGGRRTITDLEGRASGVFGSADGRAVPSVDLTQQLQHHSAFAWSLHQQADGRVAARVFGGDPAGLEAGLRATLGDVVALETVAEAGELGSGKPRQFASDLPDSWRLEGRSR